MKKRKDYFEIIKTLNHEELKVYATLDKLSQNMGYIYAGNSYIAKKIDMEKEKLQSIISILIRKKDLFYIKTEMGRLLFTNKYKFQNYLNKLEEDRKAEASDKEILALSEEKRINTEREEKELNIETDMRYKNLSSTDLFFLEEQTEDKYQSELGISYGEEQRKIFQICKEHLMKLMLKEQIKMEKER